MESFLKGYYERSRAAGETLDKETQLFRWKCVREFCRSGVPLLKLDGMREFLQGIGLKSLTSSAHLREFIPAIREEEFNCILHEMMGQRYLVILMVLLMLMKCSLLYSDG